jgi:type IX secretion system PorP/SprF family membrane protein|tara:strand:- start:159 stop:1187 length:1029 start_codon:yes stop_codon:yes gene_type:complete
MNLSINFRSLKALLIAITFLNFALFTSSVSAQDLHFTQFNAAPTSINPGYAGAAGQARAVSLYRSQWANLPQAYTGFHFAYDRPLFNQSGGIGVLVSHEEAGAGALRSSRIALQYAYEFKIGARTYVRPALQVGVVSRSVNLSDLTFMDQLLRQDATSTLEDGIITGKQYADLGTGVLMVSRGFWVGASADHINRPNSSLSHSYSERLDVRISAHGGGRIPLLRGPKSKYGKDVVVAFNYTKQGDIDQLDLGAYYDLDLMTIGVWYRGVPTQKTAEGSMDVDALSLIFGFGDNIWHIGYSYDITLNKLGVMSSGGSHELSLKYMWNIVRRSSPTTSPPCIKY